MLISIRRRRFSICTRCRKSSRSSPRKDSSQWTYYESLRDKYSNLTKGVDNKTVVFCGDIGRGRTVPVAGLSFELLPKCQINLRITGS